MWTNAISEETSPNATPGKGMIPTRKPPNPPVLSAEGRKVWAPRKSLETFPTRGKDFFEAVR